MEFEPRASNVQTGRAALKDVNRAGAANKAAHARGQRPRRRAAEKRDELATSHCPVPPVLQTTVSIALLRCGISI